jgi:LETM1-like protein
MEKLAYHYLKQAKQLPGGFRKLFNETRVGLALRSQRSKGETLSRREEIMLFKNSKALRKLALFAFVQTIPVAGWLPIIIALTYPRELLTSHFWSEDEKESFVMQEYLERCQYAKEMENQLDQRCQPPYQSTSFPNAYSSSSIFLLPRTHLKLLAGANATHGNIITHRFSPNMLTCYMMEQKAAFILRDDVFLRTEGLDDMTVDELQEALLLRGYNPTLNNAETDLHHFKETLRRWLRAHDSDKLKGRVVNNFSYILHAVASSEKSFSNEATIHIAAELDSVKD